MLFRPCKICSAAVRRALVRTVREFLTEPHRPITINRQVFVQNLGSQQTVIRSPSRIVAFVPVKGIFGQAMISNPVCFRQKPIRYGNVFKCAVLWKALPLKQFPADQFRRKRRIVVLPAHQFDKGFFCRHNLHFIKSLIRRTADGDICMIFFKQIQKKFQKIRFCPVVVVNCCDVVPLGGT